MGNKSYDSLEYFAQKFRDSYLKFMGETYGGKYTANQSRNNVSFIMEGISTHVTFSYEGEKPLISLEMSMKNGKGNEQTKTIERIMDIKRSKAGRISEDYYPELLNRVIIPNIKDFYKQQI